MIVFSTNDSRIKGQLCEKKKQMKQNKAFTSSLAPHIEINLKWTIDLKIKPKMQNSRNKT